MMTTFFIKRGRMKFLTMGFKHHALGNSHGTGEHREHRGGDPHTPAPLGEGGVIIGCNRL
jgi:hypothetical protein